MAKKAKSWILINKGFPLVLGESYFEDKPSGKTLWIGGNLYGVTVFKSWKKLQKAIEHTVKERTKWLIENNYSTTYDNFCIPSNYEAIPVK